jgi:hypothetical protein
VIKIKVRGLSFERNRVARAPTGVTPVKLRAVVTILFRDDLRSEKATQPYLGYGYIKRATNSRTS